jgi:carbonic anhydrase
MKKATLIISALALLASSCKKEEAPKETPSPVLGYWKGKYNNSTTPGALFSDNYAMLFAANGKVRVYDLGTATDTATLLSAQKADGTWLLNGTTLQVSYASGSNTINTTGTVNAAFNNMSGTWAKNTTVKGNFYLNK